MVMIGTQYNVFSEFNLVLKHKLMVKQNSVTHQCVGVYLTRSIRVCQSRKLHSMPDCD